MTPDLIIEALNLTNEQKESLSKLITGLQIENERLRTNVDIELEKVRSEHEKEKIDLNKKSQLEVQETSHSLQLENSLKLESRRAKLELIRLAKDVLVENARSKPVDARDISSEDITNYANKLINFVNG